MEKQKIYLNPLASWEEKIEDEYGLAIAESISKDWFNSAGFIDGDCEYATRSNYIANNRLIARGEQDIQSYKDHAERQKGDLDYMNVEWGMINWAGKFCNIVANGIKDEYYTLDIRANDRHTVLNNKKKADEHRMNMRTLPMLKKTKALLGIDLIPKGFIPENEEELRLYSEMNDRPKIEIAEEITIKYIKAVNRHHVIEDIKNKDLTEIGICASRIYTDNTEGIKIKSIDPEYLIHSFVRLNDFSDCYYFGYIDKSVTINDIKRESLKVGKELTNDDLRKIVGTYGKQNSTFSDYETCDINKILNYKVDVLRFSYKTLKNEVYKTTKKKGDVVKISKRDGSYNPPERNDYGKLTDIKDTWLEGTYIIGTQTIYGYKEEENIIRNELNKAESSFVVRASNIYKNRLKSFLDDIKVPAKELQKTHLKIQHLRAELKPDMTILNEDGLADLSGKGDKTQTWKEALNLLQVKNVVIEKTVDMGEMGSRTIQGARTVAITQGTALIPLLNLWAKYYNLIREITGINPARDGSLPSDALLGVSEMAQLSSNTVTAHIVDASIDFNLTVSERMSSRIHAIFRNPKAKHLRKIYEKAVGKEMIDAIDVMKDRHLHDFGFTANMIPTKEVLKQLSDDLLISLQNGLISVDVKIEVEEKAKTNTKLALEYLKYSINKTKKDKVKEQMILSKDKSKNDIASANAAAENKMNLSKIQLQLDLIKAKKLAEIEVLKQQALNEVNALKEEKEFQKSVYLEKIKAITTHSIREFQEDRKDERVSQQSTEQSKLIDQRANNKPPIDFKNKLDDIFANIGI